MSSRSHVIPTIILVFMCLLSQAIAAELPENYLKRWDDPAVQKRINDGIERNRKSDAVLTVVDADGKPVADAEVKVTQQSQEFLFGCNIFVLGQMKEKNAAYHAVRDRSCEGSGRFGITLVRIDSQLVECGMINERKNAFRKQPISAHLYSYIFNDWLYAHAYVTGPSHINLRYRYVITSHQGCFQDARAAQLAERVATPVLATVIPGAQKGKLAAAPASFLSVESPNISLLTLKLGETIGRGVMARFHETDGRPAESVGVKPAWGQDFLLTRCSLIEEDLETLKQGQLKLDSFGYATIRYGSNARARFPPHRNSLWTSARTRASGCDGSPLPGRADITSIGEKMPTFRQMNTRLYRVLSGWQQVKGAAVEVDGGLEVV